MRDHVTLYCLYRGLITNPLQFTSILMKFQQSKRRLMWLHQELIIQIIYFHQQFLWKSTFLNIAGDTSIQYHETKKQLFLVKHGVFFGKIIIILLYFNLTLNLDQYIMMGISCTEILGEYASIFLANKKVFLANMVVIWENIVVL